MPPKKEVGKKANPANTKKDAKQSNVLKPEKIAFSFTANANMNEGGMSVGNMHYVWISKAAMIKCGLSYGDIVIIQTIRNNNRVFCSKQFYFSCCYFVAAIAQLQKALKENEVLCSDSLFRCLSPQMSVIPVTVFRLTPSSTIYPSSKIILSVSFLILSHSSCIAVVILLTVLTRTLLPPTVTRSLFMLFS